MVMKQKINKMADSKQLSFSTSPKAEQFPPKFHGLVLGLVGLIDAKALIWLNPYGREAGRVSSKMA